MTEGPEKADIKGTDLEQPDLDRTKLRDGAQEAGWEYLLFADELEAGMRQLDDSKQEFEIGHMSPTMQGPAFDDRVDGLAFIVAHMDKLKKAMDGIRWMTDEQAGERVFGRPGEAGDPDTIRRYASTIPRFCAYLLGWAACLRGAAGPDDIEVLCQKVAVLANQPLGEIEDFVGDSVASIRQVVAAIRSGAESVGETTLFLRLTLDDLAIDEATQCLKRASRAIPAAAPGPKYP